MSGVDVLAVMEREISRAGGVFYQDGRDLIEVRDAFKELIEAIRFVAGFEPLPQNKNGDPCVITIPSSDLRRIRTALANVGGAK